jgi:hypothetical protein
VTEQLTAAEQQNRNLYIAKAPGVARALMQSHVDAPGSRMRFHDGTINYPAEDPMRFCIDGNPQPRAEADNVVVLVDHRFPDMMRQVEADKNAAPIIHETRKLLDEGNNVWLIMPHVGDITDAGIGPKIAINLLDDDDKARRPDRDSEYRPKKVIGVISKAMAECDYTVMIKGQPVPVDIVTTLGVLCDDVFLPWPKTKASKSMLNTLPTTELERHNREDGVTGGIRAKFAEGGTFGTLAPTGTTKVTIAEDGTYIIDTVNDATIELMKLPKTYVLPMAMWLKDKVPFVKLPSMPIKIEKPEQADELMQLMARTMNDGVEGAKFAYSPPAHRRLGRTALNG